jgi:parallel beta-helix repeat protein
MKRILKENKKCYILLFLIIISTFLISCNGVVPTDYTITATTGAGGSINPSGAIMVSDGGSQTFTIIPNEGYQVDDVLVDGISEGSIATYTFINIDQDHTIQATFVLGVSVYKVNNVDTGVGYDTIQAAINAALSGETIIVSPGTYYENIIFNNKNITVRSSNPSDSDIVAATIIDGGEIGSVVIITGEDTSTLQGFTIQNGNTAFGGGIRVENSSPVIENNTITDNMSEFRGGGIYTSQSSPTITDNTITYNNAGYGGGIYISSGNPPITGNTIADNLITDNTASYDGGGIYMDGISPIFTGNTVTGNTASGGGGVYLVDNHPFITDNTITGNIAGYGGGITLWESYPFITGNTINNNTAAHEGGGIAVTIYSDPVITDNYIHHNVADNGGGIFVDNTCSPAIGGTSSSDQEKFNTFCSNSTDQIVPDDYPNNFIFGICFIFTSP